MSIIFTDKAIVPVRNDNLTITKIKLVFIPLIVLGIAFISIYTLLYFLLYIQFSIVNLKLDVIQYWIPICMGFFSVLLIIRPRVHLLKLDRDNGRIRGLYYIVATAAFCIPTIIALNYVDTATGKLTRLHYINDISGRPATKYYTVDISVLRKDKIGIESRIKYSGKYNQYLDFDIYIAMPFGKDMADTVESPAAYLSVRYHKQISSKDPATTREEAWDNFWRESFRKFEEDEVSFVYLEAMPNTTERDKLISAAKKSDLYREGHPIILKPINEPFADRNGHKLQYIFLSFGIGSLVWFIMVIIPGLHVYEAKRFAGFKMALIKGHLKSAWEFLKIREGFVATQVLMLTNVLVFIVMVLMGYGFFEFESHDLVRLGAIYQPAVQKGEWWRFITGMFLHGGMIHLVMNMVSLYLAGIFTEPFLRTKRFFLIYLLSGVAAGIVSMWWHDKPVVAIGASGAIFGIYGVLLYMILKRRSFAGFNKSMLIFLACTAGYSLLVGFASQGIDNSAHVGGLIAGFILSFLFAPRCDDPDSSGQAEHRGF